MTWVIAILLGLILVAMISSNKDAAAGVWKVVGFAFWGFAALVAWGILIGYGLWFYDTYPRTGEWTRIFGLVLIVVAPPVFLWIARKEIAAVWRRDRWIAIKYGAYGVSCTVAWMVGGVVVAEIQAASEYGGWGLLLTALALTGSVLLWRSINGSKSWAEVWSGPPPPPDPSLVLMRERDAFDLAEDESYGEFQESDNFNAVPKYDWREKHLERKAAFEEHLRLLNEKLQAEKSEFEKDQIWSVRGFFWFSAVIAILGLIGLAWDFGFAFAMELKFVKGQAWLAGTVVTFAGLAIAGLVISALDSIGEKNSKKQ